MEGLGKVQKLKKFMESNGVDFPEEADYGKRKNKQSKFTFYSVIELHYYLQTMSGALEPHTPTRGKLSRSRTWMTRSTPPMR